MMAEERNGNGLFEIGRSLPQHSGQSSRRESLSEESRSLPEVVAPPISRFHAPTYANTKSVAQGFINITLLSANACQLKVVLRDGPESDFYIFLLAMISLSIVLQLIVAFILSSKYVMEIDGLTEKEKDRAVEYNRLANLLVTFITALNVIISTFAGNPSNNGYVVPSRKPQVVGNPSPDVSQEMCLAT